MSTELFEEGGPHKIRRTGTHQYSLSISMPPDEDGRVGRECPDDQCAPGYFKVKPGTGITQQSEAFCPYCRSSHEPSDFTTKAQIKYGKDILAAEAQAGIERMMSDALGLDSQGKRRLLGGFVNIEIEMKRGHKPHVWRPYEDVLRRDVICPKCGLDHSVFGLAVWCSDCGSDIFTTHVLGEINVVKAMLRDVERRRSLLGVRVAARDVENALEDIVSLFEATLKIELRRTLRSKGVAPDEVERTMQGIGSKLQSIAVSSKIIPLHCGGEVLFEQGSEMEKSLGRVFEKRHPITHNLGIVDRKYLERARSGETEGEEISVDEKEVEQAADAAFSVLENLHHRLFPASIKAEGSGGKPTSPQNPN